jgi:hypothetical protein
MEASGLLPPFFCLLLFDVIPNTGSRLQCLADVSLDVVNVLDAQGHAQHARLHSCGYLPLPQLKVPASTITPCMLVPCPPIHFVADSTTM